MAFTFINDSAALTSSVEYFLASDSTSKTDQTDDCILQAWLDVPTIGTSNTITIKVYEKINAGTQRLLLSSFTNRTPYGALVLPSLILGEGWEISATAGGAGITLGWSLRKITGGTFTFLNDSATISGTEYFLASDSTTQVAQTNDCLLQVMIDFGTLQAGDSYAVNIYEKINGTQRPAMFEKIVNGVQDGPLVFPMLLVGDGWDVGVKKLTGTDRTINWSLRQVA